MNIVRVVENSPSYKAGVQTGDKILFVRDTTKVAGVKIKGDQIKQLLRGQVGTKVNITVLHNNSEKKVLTIERGLIPLPSVDAAYMIDSSAGFIHQ